MNLDFKKAAATPFIRETAAWWARGAPRWMERMNKEEWDALLQTEESSDV